MMEKTFVKVNTGTTLYIPLPDESRLVGAVAVPDTAGITDSKIDLGSLDVASNYIMTLDLDGVAAGTAVYATFIDAATEAEKLQVWDTNNILQAVPSNLDTGTVVSLWIITDPFVIGPRRGY